MSDFVEALIIEMELQQHYIEGHVSTIYFGGGTPSILPEHELNKIFDKIFSTFTIEDHAEITLEANPDDITLEKLQQWKTLGINRLSIGIQSFFEKDLQWMNRAHNQQQAVNSILLAQQQGFNNLTIDLIYGTPGLTDEEWEQNVQQAIALKIPHLSCYALTVEPKTALDKMITLQKAAPVESDKQARHFELLMKWMAESDYEHYEISNFSLPGCRSKHNSSYWQGKHYIGLGPSAHSFNGTSRQWNIANNALYIKSLARQTLPVEKENLTPQQQLNEYIMTSLRTMEGINLEKINEQFGKSTFQILLKSAQTHLLNQTIINTGNHLHLTTKGKLLADGIASDLFQL